MIDAIDADDAWWPPTFTPDGVLRTLLAWWTIEVASHSTRLSTAARRARSGVGGADGAATVISRSLRAKHGICPPFRYLDAPTRVIFACLSAFALRLIHATHRPGSGRRADPPAARRGRPPLRQRDRAAGRPLPPPPPP